MQLNSDTESKMLPLLLLSLRHISASYIDTEESCVRQRNQMLITTVVMTSDITNHMLHGPHTLYYSNAISGNFQNITTHFCVLYILIPVLTLPTNTADMYDLTVCIYTSDWVLFTLHSACVHITWLLTCSTQNTLSMVQLSLHTRRREIYKAMYMDGIKWGKDKMT